MRMIRSLTVALAFGALAACGGQGDDAAGDIVERDAEAAAAVIEQKADALEAGAEIQAGALEAQADAVRAAGEGTEEAIDDADIQTSNPAAAAAAVEAHTGMPTTSETMTEATNGQQQ
jgi:hypothetical protein